MCLLSSFCAFTACKLQFFFLMLFLGQGRMYFILSDILKAFTFSL